MASGSINVTTSTNATGYIYWSSSTDAVENNRSWVTATLYLRRTTAYRTWGSGTFYLSINGNTATKAGSFDLPASMEWVEIMQHACWVNHDSDGNKLINIWCDGGLPSTSLSDINGSADVWLDTIPRASSLTLSTSGEYMGNSITVTINRASSGFIHDVHFLYNGVLQSRICYQDSGTSFTWTIPLSLANNVPNSTTMSGTIYCDTYSGTTKIGTTAYDFSAYVPTNVVPSFTDLTHSELNTSVSTKVGLYTQYLSNIRIGISGATGSYSSSIQSYTISYQGNNYSTSSLDTGTINWSGVITVSATITDSRGRTASKSVNISALAYGSPVITGFSLKRCKLNDAGTAYVDYDMGTYVRVGSSGYVSTLVNGATQKNALTYIIESSPRGANTWTTKLTKTLTAGTISLNASDVMGTYSELSSFDFRISIKDVFNTTISRDTLPTGTVTMSWSKNGVGVGKVYQSGALDVGGDAYFSNDAIITGVVNDNKRLGDTGTGTGANWYKIATISVGGQYNNFQIRINVTGRGATKYDVFIACEFGSSTWNTPTHMIDTRNNVGGTWRVTTDNASKKFYIWYCRGNDWNMEYYRVEQQYLDGASVVYDNASVGTSIPTGNYQSNISPSVLLSYDDFKIEGGGYNVNISNQNLNSYTKAGFYRGSNMVNAPNGDWWFVIVQNHDNSWVNQLAINFFNNGTYMRRCYGGTWQSWVEVKTADNFTSLFSGTSNGNGYKWCDNLMFSWGYHTYTLPIGQWTYFNYHNAFPNNSFKVFGTFNYSGNVCYTPITVADSRTQFKIYQPALANSSAGYGQITDIWYFAIGN